MNTNKDSEFFIFSDFLLKPLQSLENSYLVCYCSSYMRRSRKNIKKKKIEITVRINNQIRADELRVIGDDGENYGLLSFKEALAKAKELGQDLIEISPNATPPVAKIMDFGKYQYGENKKKKAAKAKMKNVEVKSIQVKVGTGENDLNLKAGKASKWLREGHRIKVELFLPGRTKYMEKDFLETRLERILKLITEDFNFAQEVKKVPKGINVIIERTKGKKSPEAPQKEAALQE